MARSPFAPLAAFRRSRVLTPAEYTWAIGVFGDTLPPRERVLVSPALGLQRRPFTFPGRRGRTTMHLGRDQADPVHTAPALFAHELTHVWQMHHARHLLRWLAGAVVVQARHTLGQDVYGIGDADRPWSSYGIEQQATIVEHWVADRHGPEGRRLQHHIDDDVRAGRNGLRSV